MLNQWVIIKFTPDEFANYSKTVPANISSVLARIPFNKKGVVTLDEFKAATGGMYDTKACLMSEMQPLLDGKSVLSKMQAADIISEGWNTNPEFLKNALDKRYVRCCT